MMEPAAQRLRSHLKDMPFGLPQIPVINNIDVAQETDPARIRDALFRQAFGPVRWVETIQCMQQLGVSHVVECGPGKVLSGLVKRIHGELATDAINDQASMDALLETMGS
jgi:[acyl-carrier-protein] S-malonyltransferase